VEKNIRGTKFKKFCPKILVLKNGTKLRRRLQKQVPKNSWITGQRSDFVLLSRPKKHQKIVARPVLVQNWSPVLLYGRVTKNCAFLHQILKFRKQFFRKNVV